MRRRWILLVATSAALVVGACSSGSSTSATASTTPPPTTEATTGTSTDTTTAASAPESATQGPTRDEYLATATPICAEMNARARQISQRFDEGPQNAESAAVLMREQADVVESTVAQLKALPRPPGDEATLDEAYLAAEEVPPAADAVADALARKDIPEAERLGDIADQLTAEANRLIDDYGLVECGSGSNAVSA